MGQTSMSSILPLLIGGLVIFLYAIRQLSVNLEGVFSDKATSGIEKYTKNIFRSILVGIIVTILLDSSSAVIIIAIVMINAGTLSFKQVMGIVMGANIGTTFSSQIIAFNVSQYAYILMVVTFFVWLFIKSEKVKTVAEILMYFGLLFFGLYLLEISVRPLRENEVFSTWLLELNNPLKGAAIGGLVTLIIQSSSATVGMLLTLAKQNLIGLSAATAAMLGAELGTCSDTLVAVIGGKREAVRAGVFHLIFNLIPICISLLLFDPFVSLIDSISGAAPLARKIANGHVLFSVISVLVFLPFVSSIYKLLYRIIPRTSTERELGLGR